MIECNAEHSVMLLKDDLLPESERAQYSYIAAIVAVDNPPNRWETRLALLALKTATLDDLDLVTTCHAIPFVVGKAVAYFTSRHLETDYEAVNHCVIYQFDTTQPRGKADNLEKQRAACARGLFLSAVVGEHIYIGLEIDFTAKVRIPRSTDGKPTFTTARVTGVQTLDEKSAIDKEARIYRVMPCTTFVRTWPAGVPKTAIYREFRYGETDEDINADRFLTSWMGEAVDMRDEMFHMLETEIHNRSLETDDAKLTQRYQRLMAASAAEQEMVEQLKARTSSSSSSEENRSLKIEIRLADRVAIPN